MIKRSLFPIGVLAALAAFGSRAFAQDDVLQQIRSELVVEMVEPRYMPLHGYAEAWSASTKGALLAAPVFVEDASVAEVTSMKTRLAGGIILSQPMVCTFVREDRVQPTTSDAAVRPGAPAVPRQPDANPADARQVTQLIREAGPGV